MILVRRKQIQDLLPRLGVITCLNRIGNVDAMEKAMLDRLSEAFNVNWYTVSGKEHSIGACWQAMATQAADEGCRYCIIMDDDNIPHKSMINLHREIVYKNLGDNDVGLMTQVLRDGSVNGATIDRIMRLNHIDAAQFVFNPAIVRKAPFPDTSSGPDGLWAEKLVEIGACPVNLDITCYYNAMRLP